MTLLRQIAIAPRRLNKIEPSQIMNLAAALQIQVLRDFAPMWGITASVSAFPSADDVPDGYWPIIIGSGLNIGSFALGGHDRANQPFAVVQFDSGDNWASVCQTTSHEMLEMLADPSGNDLIHNMRTVNGNQAPVDYLMEICDPCQDASAYAINTVPVSDFCTPEYYTAAQNVSGVYSFRKTIKQAQGVLYGGYISYLDSEGKWWQVLDTGAPEQYKDLPKGNFSSWRSAIDRNVLSVQTRVVHQAHPSPAAPSETYLQNLVGEIVRDPQPVKNPRSADWLSAFQDISGILGQVK